MEAPLDRTAPSRYFPFYDSSTYDAFKPREERGEYAARRAGSFQPPFHRNSIDDPKIVVGTFSQFPDIMR